MDGAFWRERLDTVLNAHHPEPARAARRIRPPRLAQAAAADAAAPHPGRQPRHLDPGVLGFRRRQVDRGGELRAPPPPRRDHRGADRRHRRRSREGAGAGRLPELLVSRPRAGQALDQPPRPPRALLRRPHARRRDRLLTRRPAGARLLDVMLRYVDHIAHRARSGSRPEARLLRPPGDRAGAGQALPPDRRQEAPRPRRLLHRRARAAAAALFRRRGGGARRRSEEVLVQELRVQPVAQAGPRAGQGRRPRGPRDVHVHRDGRSRRRARRRARSSAPAKRCGRT